jgi:hypothetical protein
MTAYVASNGGGGAHGGTFIIITGVIKSKRWAGNVACVGDRKRTYSFGGET